MASTMCEYSVNRYVLWPCGCNFCIMYPGQRLDTINDTHPQLSGAIFFILKSIKICSKIATFNRFCYFLKKAIKRSLQQMCNLGENTRLAGEFGKPPGVGIGAVV